MIHRFVDLPGVVVPAPTGDIIYRLLDTGPSRRQWWIAGNLATPAYIRSAEYSATPGLVLANARLSPDKQYVVYEYGDGSHPGEIRIGEIGSSTKTTIATAVSTSKTIGFPFWHPDGSKIIYVRESSTIYSGSNGYGEIREVNADGTGDTLLYSRMVSNAGLPFFNLNAPRYNCDGSLIAWFDDGQTITNGDTVMGTWVMNADGTGASRRVASGGAAGAHTGLIAWANTATDTFAILDFTTGGSRRLAKATTAGTVTTLSSSNLITPFEDYAWYSDDSALSVANYIYGTEPRGVVAKISVPGGTVTNFSPEERTLNLSGGAFYGPCVFGSRVYWYNASTNRVESTLDDGSDFRVDHDLSSTTLQFETFFQ